MPLPKAPNKLATILDTKNLPSKSRQKKTSAKKIQPKKQPVPKPLSKSLSKKSNRRILSQNFPQENKPPSQPKPKNINQKKK